MDFIVGCFDGQMGWLVLVVLNVCMTNHNSYIAYKSAFRLCSYKDIIIHYK